MSKKPADVLKRVSTLKTGDTSDDIYDRWATSYDDDLINEFGYNSPALCADVISERVSDRNASVIDYGCGTGLVGAALSERGFKHIDGVDVSQGMLQQAKAKNVYRTLSAVDLTMSLPIDDNVYDCGLCVGSMGAGHIGAAHVPALLGPIKSGGVFVIYMNAQYFEAEGFENSFINLENSGAWKILQMEPSNYMSALDRPGWLIVGQKNS
ncbi:MAG: methyltransferase domain-containing protein [Pseudomonadota bacterium]